jgi:pullulanase/glycogen debranching enzyme
LRAGAPYPLGAHWDGRGVNFALVAPHAQSVDLCLFDAEGRRNWRACACRLARMASGTATSMAPRPDRSMATASPGRIAPQHGKRFNPNKVLLDPYARGGRRIPGPAGLRGPAAGDAPEMPDPFDNAAIALKAQVVHEAYDWGCDAPPRVAPGDTILYEIHVKGFTRLHPDVPPATARQLCRHGASGRAGLPAAARRHHRQPDAGALRAPTSCACSRSACRTTGAIRASASSRPRRRYWSGQAGSTPISEFRDMVKALHGRGIEVVLDVVYNHTAETDEFGPTLSFRGIDNALYYHLRADNPPLYENWTGCGNCLNLAEPRVLQLVMDSLRYWVEEMHVDGFRFDLAPELARDAEGFSGAAAFLAACGKTRCWRGQADRRALGYRSGRLPARPVPVRAGSNGTTNTATPCALSGCSRASRGALGEFARRFAGSSDLFQQNTRLPTASVNFITAHDGFTLRDLVSYDDKHNEANGEGTATATSIISAGIAASKAPPTTPACWHLRARLQRALLATLFFSQGTPMLLAGDDIGHSQRGNNNAYCQDNAVVLAGLARRRPRAGRIHRRLSSAAAALSGPAPPRLVQRRAAGRRPARHRMARTRRPADGLTRRGAAPARSASACGQDPAGRNLPAAVQCAGAAGGFRPAPGEWQAVFDSAGDAAACTKRTAAWWCRRTPSCCWWRLGRSDIIQ